MGKRVLGKGLDALISDSLEKVGEEPIHSISIKEIVSNRYQPRRSFDQNKIDELAQSIRGNGLIQPIIVRRHGEKFEIIVGERRFRAVKQAGLTEIPAVIKEYPQDKLFDITLIENIQREDLNPIEEANAYKMILERDRITQEEFSNRIGKSRSYIANMIRILELPDDIQDYVSRGTISVGQAKALMSLRSRSEQEIIVRRIINEKLTVREVERITKKSDVPRGTKVIEKDPHIERIEERLRSRLGTKVTLNYRKGRGFIKIAFYSNDELERIIDEML